MIQTQKIIYIVQPLFFDFRGNASVHRSKRTPASRSPNLYPLPNFRVGERVSYESLPHPKATDRDGASVMLNRTSNQNMVSESAHEAQKGNSSYQRIK